MSVICPTIDETDLSEIEERSRESAFARSVAYALFSQLTARQPFQSADKDHFLPGDLPWALEEVEDALPYNVNFFALATAARTLPLAGQAVPSAYFGLLPDTEPALYEQDALRDLYASFDYQPQAGLAQQPGHPSVLLEFMHCLAWQESRSSDLAARLALQQAQHAFTQKYLSDLSEKVTEAIRHFQPEPFYAALLEALDSFLLIDQEWQQQTTLSE